jgi:hypothetical protein
MLVKRERLNIPSLAFTALLVQSARIASQRFAGCAASAPGPRSPLSPRRADRPTGHAASTLNLTRPLAATRKGFAHLLNEALRSSGVAGGSRGWPPGGRPEGGRSPRITSTNARPAGRFGPAGGRGCLQKHARKARSCSRARTCTGQAPATESGRVLGPAQSPPTPVDVASFIRPLSPSPRHPSARSDQRTPVKVGLVRFAAIVGCPFVLFRPLGHGPVAGVGLVCWRWET